jgi:signal transduction histidine kinase
MKQKYWWILVLVGLSVSGSAQVHLTAMRDRYLIGQQVSILEDPTHRLTLDDVRSTPYQDRFKLSHQPTPNRGFSTASQWVRFRVQARDATRKWLLEVGFANFANVTLYRLRPDGQVTRQQAGDYHPDTRSPIPSPTYVFELPLAAGQEETYYLHLDSQIGQMFFPLTIWENTAFTDYAQKSSALWGFYYGLLAFILIYHTFVYAFTRDRGYYLLTLYLLAYVFYELVRGYNVGPRYLWPQNQWLVTFGISLAAALVTNLFLVFYSHVLKLREKSPLLFYLMRGVGLLSVAAVLINVSQATSLSQQLVNYVPALIGTALILAAGAHASWQGDRPARYYLAAAIVLTTGLVLMFLNRIDVLSGNEFFVHYSLNLGSVLELILLSLGVADGIRQDRNAKRETQRELIATQQALISTLRERNAEVEAALVEGQTLERVRVAANLHDNFGARLSALRWQLMSIDEQMLGTDDRHTYRAARENLDELYQDTRLLSHVFVPSFEEGFETVLHQLARRFSIPGGVQFEVVPGTSLGSLSPRVAFEFYCITLELANNVLKHAQATRAWIHVESLATGKIRLSVSDDGTGLLQPGEVQLRSVGDRISKLKGTYRVGHRRGGRGTRITVEVPVEPIAIR